jgi:hypothetical protein
VKISDLSKLIPFLSLAVFLACGAVFSSPTPLNSTANSDTQYSEITQSNKAILISEVSQLEILINDSDNFQFQPSWWSELYTNTILLGNGRDSVSWNFQQDQRSMLEHQIFPFHFFW